MGAVGSQATVAYAAPKVTCPTVETGGTVTPAPTAGVDWSGCHLTGADLIAADISGANFSQVNLTDALLNSADASGTDFAAADFTNAQSNSTTFTNASFTGANFTNYIDTGSNFTGADLHGANISAADFDGSTFADIMSGGLTDSQAPTLPRDWTLTHGWLTGPGGMNFDGLNMTGVNLTNLNLSDSQFVKTNLTDANLSNTNFADDDIQSANFTGVTWPNVESGGITGKPAALPTQWTLVDGYLIGPQAGLVSADLSGANLTGADLSDADLYLGTLENANLTNADLFGASLAVVDITGVIWSNTICPDGSNSDNDFGTCASNITDLPPTANPSLDPQGGAHGWYTSVTVQWNWTDANATINPNACPATTSSTREGNPTTITGTCLNALGGVGTASVQVAIENKGPSVSVTGVRSGLVYAVGKVPHTGCRTTDNLSGVAEPARLKVKTTGSHSVGPFTAVCSGGTNKAGFEAAPVAVRYIVAYGLSRFSTPADGTSVARSTQAIHADFGLDGAGGHPIATRIARQLAAEHKIKVTLTGPGIRPSTASCAWHAASREFACTITIPDGVQPGRSHTYRMTALEDVGSGFVTAPRLGKAANPIIIHFS
jgi:uncharacterized protein YjbI with pentapeptide repeats